MGACDLPLMSAVCDTVGGVVGSTGEAITDGIGAWIAKSMGELAQSAADLASTAVDKTTAVDLNAEWFRDNYELLLPIGLVLTVGTFCLQLMRAAWRRDERALAQAVTGTVAGVLFAFAAIACTTVALTVVDALSAGLFKAANTSVDDSPLERAQLGAQLSALCLLLLTYAENPVQLRRDHAIGVAQLEDGDRVLAPLRQGVSRAAADGQRLVGRIEVYGNRQSKQFVASHSSISLRCRHDAFRSPMCAVTGESVPLMLQPPIFAT